MGFLLWALLTALALTAGLALALRIGASLRTGEQLVAGCVTAVCVVLGAIDLTGHAGVLYPWTVGLCVVALSLALLGWSRVPRAGWADFARRFRAAALASLRGPGALLATLAAAALVLLLAAYVYLLPSWGWDAMWYHDTLSAYAYQEHTLGWVETWIPFVNSYPKNVELLALWNVLFAPDDRLIDGAQLPLVILGVTALAATCRRAGAPPALAWGLGLCWLLLPAVFLNTPTDYVDAGAASLWLAAVLFLARLDATWPHRLFGALALGAYAGAKVSGLLHLVMLAPLVLLAVILEGRKTRAWKPLALQTGVCALLIAALGAESYVRDLVRFGNPFWPAQVPIPLLGRSFPGTWRITDFNTPPFGGPDDVHAMWRSFTNSTFGLPGTPAWAADVRLGGFGSLWLYVLLPLAAIAVLFAIAQLARRKTTPAALAVAVLLITAYATPAKWWPRYTLGFPAAGLVAAAIVLALLPRAWLQQVALVAIATWACVQGWPARAGFLAPREKEHPDEIFHVLARAWSMSPAERAVLRLDTWQHPVDAIRDQVIQPGEAAAYDSSTSFVYQLWRTDWQNRVLFRPLEKGDDPRAWLQRLDAERVRWASFARGSDAERALRGAGWTPIQVCQSEGCAVWVRPGTPLPPLPTAVSPRPAR